MPRRRANKSRKSGGNTLNVTGPGQFGQLAKLLGKNPVVLVFVYANWCGHCQHFKPDWKKLEATPNRNMAMVSISDEAFPKSPLNSLVTPEGYPTVTLVAPKSDVSVNLPTRDPEILENIVKNADSLAPTTGTAEALNNNLKNILANNNPTNTKVTLNASPQLQLNPDENDTEIAFKMTHSNVVPVTRDTINPPLSEEEVLSANERVSQEPVNMRQLGGGLWSMLTGSGASASASASALAPLNVKVNGGKRKTRRRRHSRR